MEAATHAAVEEHHGPPEANVSSRVEAQFLGMLLFIISEIMLFGAFFTAYFFVRVVGEAEWFPFDGNELPVAIAGINTAILLSSSFTMHWALEGARNENRRAMRVGLLTTFMLGLTFLCIQINEYFHLGFAISENAQSTVFYGLTGLHGAHVFVGLTLLAFATIRAFRGHFSAKEHRGVEVPGIYWHFVDIMWIFVFSTLYLLLLGMLGFRALFASGSLLFVINPLRSEQAAFRFFLYVLVVVAIAVATVFLVRAIS